MKRFTLAFALLLATLASGARLSGQWRPLKIGAGGYITGISISNDGSTRCVRADTYGAYCYDFENAIWRQVARPSNMPAGNVSPGGNGDGFGRGGGVYEIAVAPTLATRIYMAKAGSVFRSDNRGATWTLTAFTPVATTSMEANDGSQGQKFASQKIAVDPADPNVVLVGTISDGLWRTINGGGAWNQVATVPTTGRIAAIAFGSGGIVWLGSLAAGATGVYKSTDNGVTFALQAGGPNGVAGGPWIGVASGGNYWTTWGDPNGSPHKSIWFNNAGSWTDCTPASGPVLSPQGLSLNAAGTRIVIAHDGTSGNLTAVRFSAAVCTSATWETAFSGHSETYPNIGWLSSALAALVPNGGSLVGINKGSLAYDPNVDKVWVTSGVGVWSVPASSVAPTLAWTEESKGIEQLVTQKILVTPNGQDVPLIANWDFGNRRSTNPEVYQSASWQPGTKFLATWDLDYANDDPNFVVAHNGWSGACEPKTSTNDGQTWAAFPNMPPGAATDCFATWGRSGNIAVSTTTNWIWLPGSNGQTVSAAYYTTNAGTNWTKVVLPFPMTDDNDANHGWPAVFINANVTRTAVVADRATNGTFYMYAYHQGVMRSTDGGATWAFVHGPSSGTANDGGLPNNGGFDDTGLNARLSAVPGKAGQLFFTSGQQDNTTGNVPQINPLYRSVNGGVTWTKVPNILEVQTIGYGRNITQAGGGTYPRILIVGWVNNVWGVWKSDDNAATWVNIPGSSGTNFPLDVFDAIGSIEGDKTGDKIYVSFRGSGAAYYSFGDDSFAGLNATGVTVQDIGGGTGPQCSDGLDNDGDGLIDFPADTGCTDALDNDERDWTTVPLSFNSPLFTGMTEVSNSSINCTSDHRSYTDYSKTGCNTPISWTYTRNHGTRASGSDDLAACQRVNGCTSILVDHSYLNDCQNTAGGDHSDTIQVFNNGGGSSPSSGHTVTYSKSFIYNGSDAGGVCDGSAAAYRNSDGGWTSLATLDYVYIKNSAGFLAFTGDNQPFPLHIAFNNVCFEGGIHPFGPYSNNAGPHSIIIDSYTNVNQCSIVNGQVVVGAPIACSSLINTNNGTCGSPCGTNGCCGGSVTGCPN